MYKTVIEENKAIACFARMYMAFKEYIKNSNVIETYRQVHSNKIEKMILEEISGAGKNEDYVFDYSFKSGERDYLMDISDSLGDFDYNPDFEWFKDIDENALFCWINEIGDENISIFFAFDRQTFKCLQIIEIQMFSEKDEEVETAKYRLERILAGSKAVIN